jgi:type I restriction enzyme, S subunit
VFAPWLKNVFVPIPPIDEQEGIANALDKDLSEMAQQRLVFDQKIELLGEFRTCLIADVVTGKLDVLEAARSLPDEAPEPEPLDEMDDLLQDEAAAEDPELEAADTA